MEKRLTPPVTSRGRGLYGSFSTAHHHKSVRCLLDITEYPWTDYVLPTDTWKVEAVAKDRQQLAIRMAKRADPDGTNISVGHPRWMRELVMKRSTLFIRLDDLKKMRLLPDKEGLTGERGRAVRQLDIPAWRAYLEAGVPSPWPRPEPKSNIRPEPKSNIRLPGVQHSGAEVQPMAGPNRVRQSTEEQKQEQEQPQVQHQLNNPKSVPKNDNTENRGDGGSSLSGLTDQNPKPAAMTIGEALAASMNDDWLAAVSDGELNSNSAEEWLRNEWLSKEELRALRSCVYAAFDSKRDLPHQGRETQAQLMGDAMKLLSDEHKLKVPKPWVPIIKHLRASPGPSRVGAPDLPTYDVCRQELNESHKGPPERDYEKCKALGLEPCADGIWRPPEGRADKGYTVKGDDGVWRQVSSSENGQGVTR